MPYLRIETTVPQSNIPKDLAQRLCKILSTTLNKPLEYCIASVTGDVCMSWGGSTVPCAQATLMSIGQLGVDLNKKHSKAIFPVVCKDLGIPTDKMYIHFQNADKADIGYANTTFHDLL